ncbi:hypothetical protein FNV43_RR08908 [Rhamnella rubrinervis]|uniref:Pectinesterase inhibitor domain-containing protein n=1 Tax=Rhamnella rubrinervis TaxID=2594499 RepID=A0A8K0H9H8_9ROSA|nr:hypothetical protein FNV43_RR08908 [Rhamnella rubrinervis]
MKGFNVMFLLMIMFLFCHCSLASDLVHGSCTKASKSDPNLSYQFCVSTLESNPKIHTAETIQDLFEISLRLTISNASDVVSRVSKLLKGNKFDSFAKLCLRDCLELYSNAVSSLKEALCDFKSKDLYSVNVEISSAMDASTTCEDGFKERKGVVSPLTKENSVFFQLTAISLAFTTMIMHNAGPV